MVAAQTFVLAILATYAAATPADFPAPAIHHEDLPRGIAISEKRDDGDSSIAGEVNCGSGNGVWVPGDTYKTLVGQFCKQVTMTDISDGYAVSNTYLTKLTGQGGDSTGKDGKVIFQIKNDGETPAKHIWDELQDCVKALYYLVDDASGCRGKKGDTKGGTNKIGKVTYEGTVKEGDVWPLGD